MAKGLRINKGTKKVKSAKEILNETCESEPSPVILRQLQVVLAEILADVAFCCEENHLDYSLFAGTLLGAERHQGFIPWDDDIDMCMPANLIGKLVDKLKEMYGDKYYFIAFGYDGTDYPFMGLKIGKKGTKMSKLSEENFPIPDGIVIDVYPVFPISNRPFARKLEGLLYSSLSHCAAFSYEHKYPSFSCLTSKNKDIAHYYKKRRIIGLFTCVLPVKGWIWLRNKMVFSKKKTNYDGADVEKGLYGQKSVKFDFSHLTYLEFEGRKYACLKNYKDILVALYGPSYMELPPLNKRETHSYREIAF